MGKMSTVKKQVSEIFQNQAKEGENMSTSSTPPVDEDATPWIDDDDDDAPPPGFTQLGSNQAPFVRKAPGVLIVGELLGRFLRKNPDKSQQGSPYFYQIRVSAAAPGTTGSKQRGTEKDVVVNPGEVISIDESESLKELEPLSAKVEKGERFEVWLKFKEKIALQNGKSFWNVKKYFKHITAE